MDILNKTSLKVLQAYGLIVAINRVEDLLPDEGVEQMKLLNSSSVLRDMLECKLHEIQSDLNKVI